MAKNEQELGAFKKEYEEHSGDYQIIVFAVRMKVPRRHELENDPEGFRFYYTRQLKKVLSSEGEVKFVTMI